jgi:homoserine kinase
MDGKGAPYPVALLGAAAVAVSRSRNLFNKELTMRKFLAAVTAVAFLPACLSAAEIRGQVKKVDASNNRLTIMVGDKERVITTTPKVRVTTTVETRRIFPRRTSVQEYISSLDQLQAGTMVTVMTETQDGMEMATQVRTSGDSSTSSRTGLFNRSGGGRLGILRR